MVHKFVYEQLNNFILEPKAYSSNVVDKGPLMTSILTPTLQKTSTMGITKEWECQAYADGQITYRWYKNNMVKNNVSKHLKLSGCQIEQNIL